MRDRGVWRERQQAEPTQLSPWGNPNASPKDKFPYAGRRQLSPELISLVPSIAYSICTNDNKKCLVLNKFAANPL